MFVYELSGCGFTSSCSHFVTSVFREDTFSEVYTNFISFIPTDIFALFGKPEHAQFFVEYINKKHKNIKFSIETELNGSLSFLDVKIFRENEKFVTSVFRKDTFSGVYTNFISFIPLEYKFGLVHTLLNRCFNLSSDFLKFHHEVDKLKKILSKNAYPQKFVDKCIQKSLNNMYIQTPKVLSLPEKELIIILPYLGNMSQIAKTKLTKTMNKHMKFMETESFSSRLIIDLKITFVSKILFLKLYREVLFINFRVEAVQPPTLVRPIDISK